jgi:hypothetical protein
MEPLVEGVHYYIEHGRWVFTARFLRERGYCCKNGCRHCPYGASDNIVKDVVGRAESSKPDGPADHFAVIQ